jgi:hypothetical protein
MMDEVLWYLAGVATVLVIAFIGGYISRERDPRHRKYGFGDRRSKKPMNGDGH